MFGHVELLWGFVCMDLSIACKQLDATCVHNLFMKVSQGNKMFCSQCLCSASLTSVSSVHELSNSFVCSLCILYAGFLFCMQVVCCVCKFPCFVCKFNCFVCRFNCFVCKFNCFVCKFNCFVCKFNCFVCKFNCFVCKFNCFV